jgi:hypothetical protein
MGTGLDGPGYRSEFLAVFFTSNAAPGSFIPHPFKLSNIYIET